MGEYLLHTLVGLLALLFLLMLVGYLVRGSGLRQAVSEGMVAVACVTAAALILWLFIGDY